MELAFVTVGRREVIRMDNVRLIFRNFEGRGSKYNREGDRNFAIVIDDQEIADVLTEKGLNVRIKDPRDEGDTPFMYLPVKVKFNEFGPTVLLKSGRARNRLNEETVGILDAIDIERCDLDLNMSYWEVNGKTGYSVYLSSIHVVQYLDRFEAMYAGEEHPEE